MAVTEDTVDSSRRHFFQLAGAAGFLMCSKTPDRLASSLLEPSPADASGPASSAPGTEPIVPYPDRSKVALTHVDALNGILDYLAPRFRGPVIIAESSAGDTLEGYSNLGYRPLEKDWRSHQLSLLDLNRDGKYETHALIDYDLHITPVRLAARLFDPDAFIICCAVLKTHNAAVASLSVKNMTLGAPLHSPPSDGHWNDKRKYHVGIRQMQYNMLLTAQKMRPFWGATVIDGYEGMEGNGPTSGTPVSSRLAIASTDYIAADRVGLETMNINSQWPGYLVYC